MNKRSLNVAVVGVGSIGQIIARNIAFKSRSAVYLQLYTPKERNQEKKMREFVDQLWEDGAQCAIRMHTQRDTVATWSDVILVTLPSATTRDAFLDHDTGFVKYLREGQIVVDHSAYNHGLAKELQERVADRGAIYLDAPFSGNVVAAKNGALAIMCGGDEKAYNKVLPLLRLYGDSIQLMGGAGTGAATKIICQQLVAIHSVAAAEAMRMSHAMGITSEAKLMQILDSSWGASTMLRRNAPITERLLRNPGDSPPDSRNTLGYLSQELEGVLEAAEGIGGGALPLTALCHDIMAKAVQGGMERSDIAACVHFLDAAAYPAKRGASSPPASSSSQNKKKKKNKRPKGIKNEIISISKVPPASVPKPPPQSY